MRTHRDTISKKPGPHARARWLYFGPSIEKWQVRRDSEQGECKSPKAAVLPRSSCWSDSAFRASEPKSRYI
jgi:hypothetical protein